MQSSAECFYASGISGRAHLAAAERRYLDHSFRDDTAVCSRLLLFLRSIVPTSCSAEPRYATSSPEVAVQHANARGLIDGLIWPKTGCASIV